MVYEIKYRTEEEMKDSLVDFTGEIPKSWEIVKLKKILSRNDGGAWGTEADENNKIIVLRSTEQKADGTLMIINPARRKLKKIEIMQTILLEGDILITKSSGSELHIGKASYITEEVQELQCCFSNFMQRLRIGDGNSKYYYYIINGIIVKKQFVYLSTTTTGLNNINAEMINNVHVPVPASKEQKKIANFLDLKTAEFDSIISKKELLIEKLEEAKKSLISEVVTGKVKIVDGELVERKIDEMKDSGIEWLGMIPKDWGVKRLKQVVSKPLKYGANESGDEINEMNPRYIRITDFGDDGKLKPNTFRSLEPKKAIEFMLDEGDILFARSGATVGKTFQFKNYGIEACFAGYLIKATPNSKIIISDYLYFFTKTLNYENWKNSIFIQATIQNIGADKYNELKLPLPNTFKQNQICNYLNLKAEELNSIITKTKHQIQKLKEAKQALISEAVTGKIDLRDWEIEEI